MPEGEIKRLQVDGKFFRSGRERVFLKMVTYGPFPEPRPPVLADDYQQMAMIAAAGFNAVRVYEKPDSTLLDAAQQAGLWVFVGLCWEYRHDFVSSPSLLSAAEVSMICGLKSWGGHPAVAGVFIANEIPADMVRWMGVVRVKRALEELIALGRSHRPGLIFAYANFPTTEYLEPDNADITAMNVYLEQREDFVSYLPRLHNVAGDRPVLVSEFGLDTRSNGEDKQRDALLWCIQECLSAGLAGVTMYAWSDHWSNRGVAMEDWSFGLMSGEGKSKPSLVAVSEALNAVSVPEDGLGMAIEQSPAFSVIVCTHNGAGRLPSCLRALRALDYPDYEILVVDDGSTDTSAKIVSSIEGVRLISIEHAGLGAARNRGAEVAKGDIIAYTDDDCQPDAAWLKWLAHGFTHGGWDACGGPNLPPRPEVIDDSGAGAVDEVVVASAPGAPSHVLIDDLKAEHLPGCNLAVKKQSLQAVGGFDEHYWVAGDDVDFCWRLQEAGVRMGFVAGAFVWHRRRTTLWRYFKQQYHYGKAEALLMRDHPERFRRGSGALWKGQVYSGGAMTVADGSVIYHGAMGTAPYQQLVTTMQPQRSMPEEFVCMQSRIKLALAKVLQPRVRAWARCWHSLAWRGKVERMPRRRGFVLIDSMRQYDEYEARWWSDSRIAREVVLVAMFEDGWLALENDSDWDLERYGLRLLIAIEDHAAGSQVLTRMEMDSRGHGRLPADFSRRLEGLGLSRIL